MSSSGRAVGGRDIFLVGQSSRSMDLERSVIVAPLELAFPQRLCRMIGKRLVKIVQASFLAAGAGVEHQNLHSVRPFPIADFRQIVATFAYILFVFDKLIAKQLLKMHVHRPQSIDAIDRIAGQMKAIQLIKDGHVKRSSSGSLFAITVYVKIVVVGTFISEAMNKSRISVIGENHGLVSGEDGIELTVGESVIFAYHGYPTLIH